VNAITVDCANIPVSKTSCPCDVYLGGSFTATYGSNIATNIIKYDGTAKAWDNMGGVTYHKITTGSVLALYKKSVGVSDATKTLWVAGSFPGFLTKYRATRTTDNKWGMETPSQISGLNGPIHTIGYIPSLTTANDRIFFGGEFSFVSGTKNILIK
jgi:hypothetical protein